MAQPDSPDAQLARVLSHPLRPQIVQVLAVRGEASPDEMAVEVGLPLGMLSYHARLLRDLGWIELVRTVPRRGAVEHFYRAVRRAFVDASQWERLPVEVRRRLEAMTIGQVLEAAAASAATGGFDDPGAHVDRLPLRRAGLARAVGAAHQGPRRSRLDPGTQQRPPGGHRAPGGAPVPTGDPPLRRGVVSRP